LARLEEVAAAAFNVADPARVVATGGTESVLRLLPYVLQLTKALIASPTYGSHADAWQRAGVEVRTVADSELLANAAADCAMTVVNPNNPDGRVLAREQLIALAGNTGALIVDEAFGDLDPWHCVSDIAGSAVAPGMIVLRSFGKFYGLAGVRLGFVIASPAVATRLRQLLGDWPVSVDALRAGLAAYADNEWAQRMRIRLGQAAQRLDQLLVRGGMEIAGGTPLYRLARATNARARFTQLISHGVLVRPFDYDATLLRFSLPGSRDDWRRLAQALEEHP
jgi:cobalamin biosynthetic protein CobC